MRFRQTIGEHRIGAASDRGDTIVARGLPRRFSKRRARGVKVLEEVGAIGRLVSEYGPLGESAASPGQQVAALIGTILEQLLAGGSGDCAVATPIVINSRTRVEMTRMGPPRVSKSPYGAKVSQRGHRLSCAWKTSGVLPCPPRQN